MSFREENGTINTSTAIVTFFVGILISLSVALLHYYYFPSFYLKHEANEISQLLRQERNFPSIAKRLLDSRSDLVFIKLLDRNGVLEESFGSEPKEDTVKFFFNFSDNKSVIVGLKKPPLGEIDGYILLWSVLVGVVFSLGLIFFLFLRGPKEAKALKKLESAMERVSDGDLSARLEVNSHSDDEIGIMSAYQSFNRMVSSLNRRYGGLEKNSFPLGDYSSTGNENSLEKEKVSKPQDRDAQDNTLKEKKEAQEVDSEEAKVVSSPKEEKEKVVSISQCEDTEKKKEPTATTFGAKNIFSTSSKPARNVIAFVAQIEDFKGLVEKLPPSDLNSFLTSYRKAASTIISDYGGVVESLLQDEIVALFNVPDELNKPELRAVCAAVEVLQVLAKMSKDRVREGKPVIGGKVGIDAGSVRGGTFSGIPASVKEVVSSAKEICAGARMWKVYVSGNVYERIKDSVNAHSVSSGDVRCYSVTGVEEGAVDF